MNKIDEAIAEANAAANRVVDLATFEAVDFRTRERMFYQAMQECLVRLAEFNRVFEQLFPHLVKQASDQGRTLAKTNL